MKVFIGDRLEMFELLTLNRKLIKTYKTLRYRMSLKLHFLHFQLMSIPAKNTVKDFTKIINNGKKISREMTLYHNG